MDANALLNNLEPSKLIRILNILGRPVTSTEKDLLIQDIIYYGDPNTIFTQHQLQNITIEKLKSLLSLFGARISGKTKAILINRLLHLKDPESYSSRVSAARSPRATITEKSRYQAKSWKDPTIAPLHLQPGGTPFSVTTSIVGTAAYQLDQLTIPELKAILQVFGVTNIKDPAIIRQLGSLDTKYDLIRAVLYYGDSPDEYKIFSWETLSRLRVEDLLALVDIFGLESDETKEMDEGKIYLQKVIFDMKPAVSILPDDLPEDIYASYPPSLPESSRSRLPSFSSWSQPRYPPSVFSDGIEFHHSAEITWPPSSDSDSSGSDFSDSNGSSSSSYWYR